MEIVLTLRTGDYPPNEPNQWQRLRKLLKAMLRCYHLARMRYKKGWEAVEIRLQLRLLKAADNRVIREFAKTICAIRRAYRNQSEK